MSFNTNEGKRYGGAYRPKDAGREDIHGGVEEIDQTNLWRQRAQCKKLEDMLEEAGEEIENRPTSFASKALEEIDLGYSIDRACHRQCPQVWAAWMHCAEGATKLGKSKVC